MLGDLSKFGRIKEARQLLDRMPDRDKFTWNTMIVGYSSSRRLANAKQILLRNPMKNSIPWSALISGPDEYTLGSVLRMCTSLGLLLRGEQIHGITVKTGFDLDVGVVNGLLAINGLAYKAIECFRDVRREGNQPNQFIFPSVLTACAAVSARWIGVQEVDDVDFLELDEAKIASFVHCLIVKTGYGTYKLVNNAFVDMQGAFGLAYHSVKLAVAFGQLAVPSGAPIRIIKNLRVCGDFATMQ
ncbi:hypothetical protein F2Q69_00049617 [Brassica cretica]|uniref:DYW domain-containing protein n=1 Tax=Brassica cretica TaxID=69181 RepID=A0A8S9Q2J2_BRACR|nr:hypothetical protein F2Q69_00049617 [Brassica cretica]